MKIKSIQLTNEYKQIEFGKIRNDWEHRKAYTPNGFSTIKAFSFIKRGRTIKLTTKLGELICDPCHMVLTNNGQRLVGDLVNGIDKLIGYGGESVEFIKQDGPEADLYDIEIAAPHWYYTSGIVSHNSIALCNTAIACNRRNLNVLYVTLEMSKERISQRLAGIITNMRINERFKSKETMMQKLRLEEQTNKAQLIVKDYPADDVSVDVIQADIDILRRLHGVKIDVVIIDYLELLMSRVQAYNREDYTRQKKVSTEICRLAKKEHVLAFTATQTNRSGAAVSDGVGKGKGKGKSDDDLIDLNRIAESYGKAMPIDYLVTINQSKQEYEEGLRESALAKCRLYIVKNRNGPKFITIASNINYLTMSMKEEGFVSSQLKIVS